MNAPAAKPPTHGGATPAHFVGLSERARLWIILIATGLGIVSLGGAWREASKVTESLEFGQPDVDVITSTYEAVKTGKEIDAYMFVHLLNVDAHMKGITNRHTLGALAIGGGFALLALGFALFLLGADGAFKLQAENKGGGNLQLQSAAPGIFCFFGAVLLIGIGATRPHDLQIGDFSPPQTDGLAAILRAVDTTRPPAEHDGPIDREAAQTLLDLLNGGRDAEAPDGARGDGS